MLCLRVLPKDLLHRNRDERLPNIEDYGPYGVSDITSPSNGSFYILGMHLPDGR